MWIISACKKPHSQLPSFCLAEIISWALIGSCHEIDRMEQMVKWSWNCVFFALKCMGRSVSESQCHVLNSNCKLHITQCYIFCTYNKFLLSLLWRASFTKKSLMNTKKNSIFKPWIEDRFEIPSILSSTRKPYSTLIAIHYKSRPQRRES